MINEDMLKRILMSLFGEIYIDSPDYLKIKLKDLQMAFPDTILTKEDCCINPSCEHLKSTHVEGIGSCDVCYCLKFQSSNKKECGRLVFDNVVCGTKFKDDVWLCGNCRSSTKNEEVSIRDLSDEEVKQLPKEVLKGLNNALEDVKKGRYTVASSTFCECKGLEPRSSFDTEKGICVNCSKIVKLNISVPQKAVQKSCGEYLGYKHLSVGTHIIYCKKCKKKFGTLVGEK